MDNLVHILVGTAIAGQLIPASTSLPVKRAVVVAAVVAANAADLDFAYVWITEPPLGFLLHHRGHTHTIAGALGVASLLLLALRSWAPVRRDAALPITRLLLIIGLAALSHLLIDAANVFGVVFWYPFSTHWTFGDISFIVEPWLWLVLGVPIARSLSTTGRVAVITSVTAAMLAAVAWRVIPTSILPALAGIGLVCWYIAGAMPARRRMTMALMGAIAVFALLAGLSSVSRQRFEREAGFATPGRVVLDVVLEPDPGTPWCWSGLAISTDAGAGGVLRVRRGTLSLLPRVWPVTSCASVAVFETDAAADVASGLAWTREWTMPAEQLRSLGATDCRVSAWLRFGRAPMLIDGSLRDLRLENPVHRNFTALTLEPAAAGCPSYVPPWTPPRADMLGD